MLCKIISYVRVVVTLTFVNLDDVAVAEFLEVAYLPADSEVKFLVAGDGALVYHLEGDLQQEERER